MLRSMMLAKMSLAGIFVILATGAQATVPEGDDQTVPATQAELATQTVSPRTSVPLRSPATKTEHSKKSEIDGSRRAPPTKREMSRSPVARDKDNGTASASGDAVAKGHKMTIIADEEAGIEYFCRHSRRRLWVQNKGWVIRRVPSCF
jgi:hypothetical protein